MDSWGGIIGPFFSLEKIKMEGTEEKYELSKSDHHT